jgi:hypothetical protein
MTNLHYGDLQDQGDTAEPRRMATSPTTSQEGVRQPLGVLLVCTRNAHWHGAPEEARHPFDLTIPKILKFWEKRVGGRIYRVYAGGETGNSKWEFFTLLECDDLPAWNARLQKLEEAGFNTFFDWDIIALGRSLG